MDTAVIQQFLNFFQDYIDLCQSNNWPDNDTSEEEIKNAFLISQHIEKCLDKLHKKGLVTEFMSALNDSENISDLLKDCLVDPPKYILKKIINSNTKINQMDVGFRLFLELFSEDKLEGCLADLMLEAASKETLLKNLDKEIPHDRILKFKSEVLLSELCNCDSGVIDLIKNCSQATVEVLVVSLLNNDSQYQNAVKLIADAFLCVVISKDIVFKQFWRQLFKVDDRYLIEMCLENSDIFTYIVEALSDCCKLIRECMTAESFYIDLSKEELDGIVQKIYTNECLKSQFLDIVQTYDSDVSYWQNIS
ncbi:ubiquitin-fold modifier 1 isoform X1 [Anticarsia gemmatalis]|uniref:ubiquitin-fold modifier 1 isoform X1 n=1 Tax=Anticarsia gemmatalis TaxID=129554 RepID=UPI003F773D39